MGGYDKMIPPSGLPDACCRAVPLFCRKELFLSSRALEILNRVFGLRSFRGFQEDVIDYVCQGGDALVLMPTGGGKSLCYQIPALMRSGVGVVISPLIALMADQVASLEEVGVRAGFLNSTLSQAETNEVKRRLIDDEVDLLYIAPERLMTPSTMELLEHLDIALFAIDEAHCVSMWGHDFRPVYGQMSVLRDKWPTVPRIALTATADLNTRQEICDKLLTEPQQFVASFDRPNIRYRIEEKRDANKQLVRFIDQEHPNECGIVYCLSRDKTEKIADMLCEEGIPAMAYHAGLPAELRRARQERFLREDGMVMVATIAFGMGIDKPDVRFVAHVDMPKSIENYFQETGRAGRDGEPADAWMCYGLQDVINQTHMIERSQADDVYKRRSTTKLEAMLALAETVNCRRQMILEYFGETSEPCDNCDNCLEPPRMQDATIPAKKLVSTIYRLKQHSDKAFGARHVFDILLGVASEKVLLNGHETLSTFGIGKELDIDGWRRLLRQMIAGGMIFADADKFNALVLGDVHGLLKEDQTIRIRQTSKKTRRLHHGGTKAEVVLGEDDQRLFERLRGWRRYKAAEADKPPYLIFPDATLKAIAQERPRTLGYLSTISGVGEAKLDHYGEEIIQLVQAYEAD